MRRTDDPVAQLNVSERERLRRLQRASCSDANTPMAPMIFSGGNSSRTIPNDSGITPPPTPCTTQQAINNPIEEATAATKEPTANTARATTKTRFLPMVPPIRPTIGVTTDAAGR
jgi:hypothetical protein